MKCNYDDNDAVESVNIGTDENPIWIDVCYQCVLDAVMEFVLKKERL